MFRSDRPSPSEPQVPRSDAALAQRIAAGDERAFDVLVQRHRARLVRVASQVLQDGRAEDAVQVALLATYRALRAGDIPANLAGWMSVVTRHAAIDQHRRLTPLEPYPDIEVGVAESAGAAAASREELRHVLAEVAALPPSEREALLLRAIDGAGHREIGARMNVSPGQARQLIHRARLHLRDVAAVLIPAWFALRVHEARAATSRLTDAASASPVLAPGRVVAVIAAVGVGGAGLAGAGAGLSDGSRAVRGDQERAAAALRATRTSASSAPRARQDAPRSGETLSSAATATDRRATVRTSSSEGGVLRVSDPVAAPKDEADERTTAPTGPAGTTRPRSSVPDPPRAGDETRSPTADRAPQRAETDPASDPLPAEAPGADDSRGSATAPGSPSVESDRDEDEVEVEEVEAAEAPEGPEDDGRVRDEDGPEPPEPGDG